MSVLLDTVVDESDFIKTPIRCGIGSFLSFRAFRPTPQQTGRASRSVSASRRRTPPVGWYCPSSLSVLLVTSGSSRPPVLKSPDGHQPLLADLIEFRMISQLNDLAGHVGCYGNFNAVVYVDDRIGHVRHEYTHRFIWKDLQDAW